MATKNKKIRIKFAMFKTAVNVWLCPPEYIKGYYDNSGDPESCGETMHKEGEEKTIWINSDTNENKIAVLAHEALHAISLICKERDIEYDEELFAYGVEYIVKETLRKIKL